jgi:hypothetical protein
MPHAHRHHRAKLRAVPVGPTRTRYEIVDKAHKPDDRGQFAGVPVERIGGQQVVALTDAQAKFWLDNGAIRPLSH